MASDDIGGVWRTIGGRRVFIKDGDDLETAMKKSGKFKNAKSGKKNYKEKERQLLEDYTKLETEDLEEYYKDFKEKGKEKFAEKIKKELDKRKEITKQGKSNRKEVSQKIQDHILEYYDSEEDFVNQMEAMNYQGNPTPWGWGEELAEGGSYLVYTKDMSDFLDSLKINPKGKSFSDDKVFQTYKSLIGRESARLYQKLKKNK